VLSGLPACGKSTKAKEMVKSKNDVVRVNRDLLREMLYFIERSDQSDWNENKEKFVKELEMEIAKFALKKHKSVIVDDTNLAESTRKKWEDLALQNGAKSEIIEMDTSVEECIRRDSIREQPVGPAVIKKFAGIYKVGKKYGYEENVGAKKSEKITFPGEKKIILSDIDGTLANCSHREHFLTDGPKKNWDGFFGNMDKDAIRENTLQLLTLTYADHPIVLVTGRPSNYREITEKWLKDNNVPYRRLLMRAAGDFRPDNIVKEEILLNHFNKDEIEMVIDDRRKVLDMWRRNNLPTINVGGENNDF